MQTPLLFAEEQLPWQPAYDADAVRERLETVLVKMRAAANWPWKAATVEFYRESLWPSLLSKLPDTTTRSACAVNSRQKSSASTRRPDRTRRPHCPAGYDCRDRAAYVGLDGRDRKLAEELAR